MPAPDWQGAPCYHLLPWRTDDQWRLSLALHLLGEPCEKLSSLTQCGFRVVGGARAHHDLIFAVELSHPRRRELWQLLHQRQLRRVSSHRRRTGIHQRFLNPQRGSLQSRLAPRRWFTRWSAHDERGGELLQHQIERDDPCRRPRSRAQRQCQRIWLRKA